MLSLDSALAWRPNALYDAAVQFEQMSTNVFNAYSSMRWTHRQVKDAWDDRAAQSALSTMATWMADVNAYQQRLDQVRASLTEYSDQLAPVHSDLVHTVDSARSNGFHITSGGLVIVPPPTNPVYGPNADLPQSSPGDVPQDLSTVAPADGVAIEEHIQKLLARMTMIDSSIAGMLDLFSRASTEVSLLGHSTVPELPIPSSGMNPAQSAQWWKGLSAAQRSALLSNGLGSLYGIKGLPTTVEDQVNRWRLSQETSLTTEMLARAKANNDPSLQYWEHANTVCVKTQAI